MLLSLYHSVDASPSGAASALVNITADYAFDRSAFAYPAFIPSAPGTVEVSAAELTLGQAPYVIGVAKATQQRAVLRTASVYASPAVSGRNTVLVAVQLSDAEGNTAVEQSGLSLSLVLRSSMGNVTTVCPLVDVSSGLTMCTCASPAEWFSSSETGSAEAIVQLNYDGTLRLEEAVGIVALQRLPVQSTLAQSGMTLTLPSAPLYVGDSFTASISASLVGVSYELMAWTISLGYEPDVLSLQDQGRYEDAIWVDAIITQQTGSLKMIVLKPLCAPDCGSSVSGRGVPIATATFTVRSGSEGTHASAVWLRVASMSNFGNSIFVEGQDALALDGRDGGNATGQVVVKAAAVAGLFGNFAGGSTWLQNTAPLTGVDVSKGLIVRSVSKRPADPDSSDATATCTSDAGSAVLTLSGCTAVGTAAASTGGTATITARTNGLSVPITLRVWHPAPLSLQLDNAVLSRLDGCAADVDGSYQATRLRVLSGVLDVTPLLGAASGVAALLSVPTTVALEVTAAPGGGVARLTVRGVARGSGEISLVYSPAVSIGVEVSGAAVTVASLYVGALTAGDTELVLSPSGVLARGSGLTATYRLRQLLMAEGDTAHVLAVATLSDNTTMLVPAAQLNLTNLRTSSLLLAAPIGSDAAVWSVSVSPGAVRECGMLLAAQWAPCGGVPTAALVELFLQLPEPKAVRVSGVQVSGTAQKAWAGAAGLTLAPLGDMATLNGIDVPSSVTFSAEVDFVDPVSGKASNRTFGSDARTSFSTNNPACATFEGRVLTVQAGCSAAELFVTASVDFGGEFGTLSSVVYRVSIATYLSVSLRLDVYPEGPTNVASARWLRKVQCTDTYQRVQPHVTATLSTGDTRTVTEHCSLSSDAPSVVSESGGIFAGEAPGTAVARATFGSGSSVSASASVDLTVDSNPIIVTSMELTLSGGGVLYGERGTQFPSTLKVVLADGTVYRDVHGLSWLNATEIVSYSSDTPSAVAVLATGAVVLRDNHHSLVTVTATTTCSPSVSAVDSTAPNLKMPFRGVDLGVNNALQFSAVDGIVSVPVLVNAGDLGAKLTSFQIVVSIEYGFLHAVSHSEGVTAGSLATAAFSGTTVTLNDPVWEVLLNGNTDASVAPTGLVQLATLALEVQEAGWGKVTFIQARLVGLVTCIKCDDTDDNSSDGLGEEGEVGGSGYVLLPYPEDRRQRRGLRLSAPPPRVATAHARRALAQPDGSCCGSSVGVDAFYGDINGDCVFDIKDVRRASLLLLSQQSGSTDVPTEYQGDPLCPWQQQQLDPTLDGAFKSNDAVYLLLVLSRKYRFLGSSTLTFAPPQQLDFQATLFDEHSAAADKQAAVRLELQYAPDGVTAAEKQPSLDYELGAEELDLSSEDNLLAKAAGQGGGTGVYALRASGRAAWATGAAWRVVSTYLTLSGGGHVLYLFSVMFYNLTLHQHLTLHLHQHLTLHQHFITPVSPHSHRK